MKGWFTILDAGERNLGHPKTFEVVYLVYLLYDVRKVPTTFYVVSKTERTTLYTRTSGASGTFFTLMGVR